MAAPDAVVNLEEKLALFADHWSPRIVGQVNDMHLKVAKGQSEFPWHVHEETDEFFLVVRGSLTVRMRGREDAVIGACEFFVVPRGIEHAPLADEECALVVAGAGGDGEYRRRRARRADCQG